MKILLETKKYDIYCYDTPMAMYDSRRLMLQGFLVNKLTEVISYEYQKWSKDHLTTLEKLGKKLYKKAKRIK